MSIVYDILFFLDKYTIQMIKNINLYYEVKNKTFETKKKS